MKRRKLSGILIAAMLVLFFAGCKTGNTNGKPGVENSTDQLYREYQDNMELTLFCYDNELYTVDYMYRVNAYEPGMRDGGFYQVNAEGNVLNGGVAGYVDYPEIESVHSVEEISPLALDLPSIRKDAYGLYLIKDYADGDVLLDIYGKMAVWKDGEWVYRYDREIRLDDDRTALAAKDTTKEEILSGMENGILSCREYFVMPEE